MKSCFKCHVSKPLSEFYPQRRMADGHLNKCKACTKADVAARQAELANDPEWVAKEATRHRMKTRRYRENGRVKRLDPAIKRATIDRYFAKYPEKKRAHSVTANAIKTGALVPQPCERCGKKAQAHHDDYSKPLEVRWLCPEHHAQRHVELRWENK